MKQNYRLFSRLMLALAAGALVIAQASVAADDTVPLKIKWPRPTMKGTPNDLPSGPNIEPPPDMPPDAVMVPKDAVNVAKGKKATASDKSPFNGNLTQVTDGTRDAYDDQVVEMRKGTQWVQVDLEAEYNIHAIALWHDQRSIQVFRDVVVQVADDADFTKNVRTIFNNDMDNSSGLGIGTNKEYFETQYGKILEVKGEKARYVRSYTKGSNKCAFNCIQEIEVYGTPAK